MSQILSLAIAVLCAFAVFVLLANLTLFTFAFAGRGPRPAALPRAFIKELCCSAAIFAVTPLFFLGGSYRRREGAPDLGPLPPVVLLHGFGLTRTTFLFMGPMLARRGLDRMHALTYWTLDCVDVSATRLQAFVERVAAREGAEQVDVVTHSWGGVVARWYIEKLGGASRVRRLVMIEPPSHGTEQSRFALGCTRRQIGVNSPQLVELGPPAAGGPTYATTWSWCDEAITPSWSSRLLPFGPMDTSKPPDEPPLRTLQASEFVFDDFGHITACVSPRVADLVVELLSRPDPPQTA